MSNSLCYANASEKWRTYLDSIPVNNLLIESSLDYVLKLKEQLKTERDANLMEQGYSRSFKSRQRNQEVNVSSHIRVVSIVVLTLCSVSKLSAEVSVKPSEHIIKQAFTLPASGCAEAHMHLEHNADLYGSYIVQGAMDNRLDIELLDEWNRNLRVARQPYQHFNAMSGTVNGGATLKFKAPKDGNYFIEFCNGKALLLSRSVYVDLYTTRSKLTAAEENLRAGIEKIVAKIRSDLMLPSFDVQLAPCGVENAFSNPNITICNEIVESFPREQAPQLFTFVFLHELGHTVLKLWGLPGWDNEDMADEFASAVLLLGSQPVIADSAANWWLSKTQNVQTEALAKIGIDDRHSLSIQRARNIHRWAQDDGELSQRWIALFAPHMADNYLAESLHDKRFEKNQALIQEASKRKGGRGPDVISTVASNMVASPAVSSSASTHTTMTDRLRDLKAAHDAGLITDDEFKAKRELILRDN